MMYEISKLLIQLSFYIDKAISIKNFAVDGFYIEKHLQLRT